MADEAPPRTPTPTPAPTVEQLFPWQGTKDPAELEIACAQIARRLIAGERKAIGFVAAVGAGELLPVLVRLGLALYPFQQRAAAVIPAWRTWDAPPPHTRRLGNDEHGPTVRPLGGEGAPTLLVPPPAPDESTAVLSLQLALRRLDKRFPQVLVDLTGLPGVTPDEPPAALRLMDGVVVVGRRGKTTSWNLGRAARQIPDDKTLGVLLIG